MYSSRIAIRNQSHAQKMFLHKLSFPSVIPVVTIINSVLIIQNMKEVNMESVSPGVQKSLIVNRPPAHWNIRKFNWCDSIKEGIIMKGKVLPLT